MKAIAIGANEHGQRVDRLVGKLIPRAEKGLVYKAIRKKIVTLNGKKTQPDARVCEGDELKLFFSDDTLRELGGTVGSTGDKSTSGQTAETVSKKNASIKGYEFAENIIYEDTDVILVYKPAGILSQGSDSNEVSLNDLLIDHLSHSGKLSGTGETFKPSVCNRLDRNTSGLVIFAKKQETAGQFDYKHTVMQNDIIRLRRELNEIRHELDWNYGTDWK